MLQGKKLLVVDDEPDLREILRDEFIFEGADVSEAKNGNEAFQIVLNKPIELVLSDIRMPGGDGVSLLRNIKGRDTHQPAIILITGFADISASEAYEIGAEGFFAKPFQLEDLLFKVKSLLLPLQERWMNPRAVSQKKIITKDMTFQEAVSNGEIKLGRGGFFMKGDIRPVKLGEVLQVKFSNGIVEAWLRWTRFENTADTKMPMGVGLEIGHVSAEILPFLLEQIPLLNPKAFIPRS